MVEGAIEVLTFGRGKEVATEIANIFGYKECGCDKRKAWLNKIVGCSPSPIKLDLDATNSTGEQRTYETDRPQNNHPLRDI